MFKRLWNDPVWSKVIATAILALSASVSYYFNLFPMLWSWLKAIFAALISTTPVWNGLLIIWGIATLAVILRFAVKVISNARKPWRRYTEDTFHNLRWRWQYDRVGKVTNLKCYCRRCDFEIVPTLPTLSGKVYFTCNSCGASFQPTNLGQDWKNKDWQSIITREILKKIINGEWSKNERGIGADNG